MDELPEIGEMKECLQDMIHKGAQSLPRPQNGKHYLSLRVLFRLRYYTVVSSFRDKKHEFRRILSSLRLHRTVYVPADLFL